MKGRRGRRKGGKGGEKKEGGGKKGNERIRPRNALPLISSPEATMRMYRWGEGKKGEG